MEQLLSPQSKSTVDSFVSKFAGVKDITSYRIADLMLSIFNVAIGLRDMKNKSLDINTLKNVIVLIYDEISKDDTNDFQNNDEVASIIESLIFFYENGVNKNNCCVWICSKKNKKTVIPPVNSAPSVTEKIQ